MKLKKINQTCDGPRCFERSRTNLILADTIKQALLIGNSRLKDPIKNNEVSIIDIFDAIGSQSCVRIRNYKPDKNNKHLKAISLGPSYLESQISKAIDKAVEKGAIPKVYVPYIRSEIGLDKEKKKKIKPELSPAMRKQILKKQNSLKKLQENKYIQDLPKAKIPIDLPPLRQSEHYSCGATVIQMISAYYGSNIREQDLISKLGITNGSGVRLSKIEEVANDIGLSTKKAKLEYEQLLNNVDRKLPTMVAIQKEKEEDYHFVIIVGYYDDGIIFRDPSKFIHGYLNKDEFANRCFKADDKYLALIIYSNKKPDYADNMVEKS